MMAGKRDQRVTLQQRTADLNGDLLGAWNTGITRWASVVARTRGEVALEQRLQGLQPVEVTILADSGTVEVTTAWRLVWKGVPYNIMAVAPNPDRAQITLLAQADQSDA